MSFGKEIAELARLIKIEECAQALLDATIADGGDGSDCPDDDGGIAVGGDGEESAVTFKGVYIFN